MSSESDRTGGAPAEATQEAPRYDPLQSARTGDVFLMNRKCLPMRDPLAIFLCLCTKTENRFDHVGMLVKLSDEELKSLPEARKRLVNKSPTDTYVLETNMKGVTLYSAEQRIARSSANELAIRPVGIAALQSDAAAESSKLNKAMLDILETMYDIPYQSDPMAILPSFFSTPDKIDRVDAAYKINALAREIRTIRERLGGGSGDVPEPSLLSPESTEFCHALVATYKKAQSDMLDVYFPHLRRLSRTEAQWDEDHFVIDGANYSPRMVCTELIGNLWTRSGITNGFVPASSLRPFDFLDDTRFNFTRDDVTLGALLPVKTNSWTHRFWLSDAAQAAERTKAAEHQVALAVARHASGGSFHEEAWLRERLQLYNRAARSATSVPAKAIGDVTHRKDGRVPLPQNYVVQSNDQDCVRYAGQRIFASGVVFAFWAVPCAPLTLRWVEGQVGLFLVRGSVWSLACGLFARNMVFVGAQGLVGGGLGALLAARPGASMLDVMRRDGAGNAALMSNEKGVEGEPAPATPRAAGRPSAAAGLVDWRHPFFSVVAIFGLSSLAAHVVSQPIVNMVIAHHFGPLRAGPMPRRFLMKGVFCLAPFSILVPLQGYFLTWYETCGSTLIPTRSSVLRPRQDLLGRHDWPHHRNEALMGAMGAMVLFDLLLYPFHTGVTRSLVKGLYQPQPSPSIGRRFFPGYRYRFASNLLISAASCATLSFAFNLI